MSGVGADEERDVGAVVAFGYRRGGRTQALVAPDHDAALTSPRRAIRRGGKLVDERGLPLRRRLVVSRPVVQEIARQQQVTLVAERVEEPERRSQRVAPPRRQETAQAQTLHQIAAAPVL